MALALEGASVLQKLRPGIRGLQFTQDCLPSMRGGSTSVLVVETKCNVLLVEEERSELPSSRELK